MSPVQPSRSSRWGQSVGTSTKLPRWPQTTLLCSRLSRSSEHSKVPVRSQVGGAPPRPSRSSAVSSPGQPSTSGVAEAVEGEGRLEDVLAAAEDEPVGGLGRRAAGGCRARRARAPRRAGAVITGAGRTLDGEPQPADQVLAEVDQGPPARRGPDPLRGRARRPAAPAGETYGARVARSRSPACTPTQPSPAKPGRSQASELSRASMSCPS